jgi:hypothetical protein
VLFPLAIPEAFKIALKGKMPCQTSLFNKLSEYLSQRPNDAGMSKSKAQR